MSKAELIVRHKEVTAEGLIIEAVIWKLSKPVSGCFHPFKYRLHFGTQEGDCMVGYDNERGKGDHRHVGRLEEPYRFTTIKTLLVDFRKDVERAG